VKSLTRSEFARRNKVVPSAITKAIAAGRLPLTADGQLGADAQRAWNQSRSMARSHAGKLGELAAVKLEREQIRAARERLELETARGRMLDRDEVIAEVSALVVQFRNRSLRMAYNVAPKVAMRDRGFCQAVIEEAVRENLQELSAYAQSIKQNRKQTGKSKRY
jgi:hypothetical protein